MLMDFLGKPIWVLGKRVLSQACVAMEVQAMLEAFKLLKDSLIQYRVVEIQTNSMLALSEVRKIISNPPEVGPLAEVIAYARCLDGLRITHIYREGNAAADWVARDACCHEFAWNGGMPLPKPLVKLMLIDFLFDPP
ncbi:hypothetical protein HPP92_017645 [Vanilla planifolia]|uniref:RNase H type-1 domain-containing protein n=1 Tax=Vanilla planifolia TaxID=51239 RepID=A0A835Q890_VANPL|nr:hypothetical protein HPP92_017645 [Vanilla planifolia]